MRLRSTLLAAAALVAAPALALPGTPVTITVNPGGRVPTITAAEGQLDVRLNASRTLLRYNGFDIAAGEAARFRFQRPDHIAIVSNIGQTRLTLDGTVQALVGEAFGGNLWFLSPTGILVGDNARIDVGGALFAIATPRGLRDPVGPALDPDQLRFVFDPATSGLVEVAGGARITGHGGTLAFVAPVVTTAAGATIGGAGDTAVLYGSAERFTLSFARQPGDDLDLISFEVPVGSGGLAATPLALAGTTTAGNIYVAAVSRAEAARALIDASGTLTATDAALEGGAIVLSAGGGIVAGTAGPATGGPVDLATGALDAAGDLVATASGSLAFGAPARAGGTLRAAALDIAAGALAAGQDVLLRASGGNLVAASVEAGDDLLAEATGGGVTLGAAALTGLGSDRAGDPGGFDADGDGRRMLLATLGETPGDVRLGFARTGGGPAGGALPADTLTGGDELVIASGGAARVDLAGDARLTSVGATGYALVEATGALSLATATVAAGGAGSGQLAVRAASATLGDVTAAGDVLVLAEAGDATLRFASAGDDVILDARAGAARLGDAALTAEGPDVDGARQGETALLPGFDRDAAGNGRVVALYAAGETGDAELGPAATLAGATRVDIAAARDAILDLAGAPPLATVSAGRDLRLTAAGTVSATTLTAGQDLVLTAGGPATLGDVTAGRDLALTAAALDLARAAAGRDATLRTTATTLAVADRVEAGLDLTLDSALGLTVGDLAAAGALTLIARDGDLAGGALTAGAGLAATATGALVLASAVAGGDASFSGARVAVGDVTVAGALDAAAAGALQLGAVRAATGTFTADTISLAALDLAGAGTLAATGLVTLGDANTGALAITAGDLDLAGPLVAASLAVATPAALRLGTATGAGLRLDGAELARLRIAGAARFEAGLGEGTGDLSVGDLVFDAAALPEIDLVAAADSVVEILGRVLPAVSGTGLIRVGEADPNGLRPGAILVSGGFGDATIDANCFTGIVTLAELTLRAVGDVLFGDAAFQAALAAVDPATIDLARGGPALAPRNDDAMFAVATRLVIDTPGTVASQDSASARGGFTGLLLGVGEGGASALTLAGGPAAVDLSGAVVDAGGTLLAGPLAARVAGIGPGGEPPRVYRLNGCALGGDLASCGLIVDPASRAARVEDIVLPAPGLDSQSAEIDLPLDVIVGATTPATDGAGLGLTGPDDDD